MTVFIHVEEPSMEDALKALLPRLMRDRGDEVRIIDHGSKQRLLRDLKHRLAGYRAQLSREDGIRVLVVIDRDDDDCTRLKARLEEIAANAGLSTKSTPDAAGRFHVVNRIVIEELEAWFFGDISALCAAYPGVPPSLARKRGFRQPDAITGGTWERLLKELQKAGYYESLERLPKREVARRVAAVMDPARNCSPSFRHFVAGLDALLA
ncbi:MAG: DUF4276 family protein [Azospirillaceae bacterium]|nr:DUF4276 family protein [Azospirillaceae bacterium]